MISSKSAAPLNAVWMLHGLPELQALPLPEGEAYRWAASACALTHTVRHPTSAAVQASLLADMAQSKPADEFRPAPPS
jgi:hypothetical protein